MAREKYDPNDLFDQLAALSEAKLIETFIDGIHDRKTKMIFNALIKVLNNYGIKGFDAFRFINELSTIFIGIDTLEGDE